MAQPTREEREELRQAIPALMRGRVAQPGEKPPRDPARLRLVVPPLALILLAHCSWPIEVPGTHHWDDAAWSASETKA